jgi:hypothetical protein
MVTPYRITQIQIAGIGGRTHDGAANRANRGSQGRITSRSTDRGAAGRTKQCTACCAITGIGAATGQHQSCRKAYYHCRAHVWLP